MRPGAGCAACPSRWTSCCSPGSPFVTVTGAMKPATVVFGAFDRHNFGDLLFAHVAAAFLKKRAPVFAGLADVDLRPFGGHRVSALPHLPARLPDRRVDILHAGGELLTCTAWQA